MNAKAEKVVFTFGWFALVFMVFAIMVLFLSGCQALQGRTAYTGNEAYPSVRMKTLQVPPPPGWRQRHLAIVSNPYDHEIVINLMCTAYEARGALVPPHMEQVFVLFDNDRECSLEVVQP